MLSCRWFGCFCFCPSGVFSRRTCTAVALCGAIDFDMKTNPVKQATYEQSNPISRFSRESSSRPRVVDCNYCNSYCWTAQRTRCLMSVSVDIPGHGYFDIKLTASSTAADIILLLRERLPDSPWHGNKLLSSGVCQLQCDDIVEATHHSTLVLTNYSEITNQETHLPLCSFFFGNKAI